MSTATPRAPRRAVVVGAGVGGLAAARGLQRAGWQVVVLERAPRLDPVGAGISLWPNAVHALQQLEVPLPDDAATTGEDGIRTSDGQWLTRTRASGFAARYGAPVVVLHRADLQHALLASLRPGTVLTGTEVTAVHPGHDRVVVSVGRTEHRADLVVLADGAASPTRHLVTGPAPRTRYAGYTAWRAVTPAGAGPPLRGATESWGRGQRFGLVPLVDGRTYWFATATTAAGGRSPDGEHAEVLRRFAAWHAPVAEVLHATDPSSVLRHDVHDLHPAPAAYARGRLVLLGDAAHAMTPDLGQGACQALEDAVTLGALLPPGADLSAALTRYDRVRRPRAQRIARRSRQLGRLGQLSHPAATAARDLLLRRLPASTSERRLDELLGWRAPGSTPRAPTAP